MPTAIWRLLLRPGSAHCDLALAVAVRVVPATTMHLQLRSGSAQCDLALAVEV